MDIFQYLPQPPIDHKVSRYDTIIDLDPANPDSAKYHSRDAAHTNYIYIKLLFSLDEHIKDALYSLGIKDIHHFHGDTYICRYEATDLEPIRQLPFVQHANCFHKIFKIMPEFFNIAENKEEGYVFELFVQLHKGVNWEEQVADKIEKIEGVSKAEASRGHVIIWATRKAWDQIVEVDEVDEVRDLQTLGKCVTTAMPIPHSQPSHNNITQSPTRRGPPIPRFGRRKPIDHTITLHRRTIDFKDPIYHSPDASTSNYIFISCIHDISTEEEDELRDLGVETQDYLGKKVNYLCRYTPSSLEPIRQLPFIAYTGVWQKEWKIGSVLMYLEKKDQFTETEKAEGVSVWFELHRGAREWEEVLEEIAEIEGVEVMGENGGLKVEAERKVWESIAAIDDVKHLEYDVPLTFA